MKLKKKMRNVVHRLTVLLRRRWSCTRGKKVINKCPFKILKFYPVTNLWAPQYKICQSCCKWSGVYKVLKKKVCIIGTFFHETYFKKNIKSHILNYSIWFFLINVNFFSSYNIKRREYMFRTFIFYIKCIYF
jgi:hypothetical protein